MKFKPGDKIYITRDYANRTNTLWYKKGTILTVSQFRDPFFLEFDEFPNAAFSLSNDAVKITDFIKIEDKEDIKIARVLYEK